MATRAGVFEVDRLGSPWQSGRIIQALPYQSIRGVWLARDQDIFPQFDLADIPALRPIRCIVDFAFTFEFPRLP
jgi:hypothetical protein